MQIDVFARAAPEKYSVIGEVKSRDVKKFSLGEARRFSEKVRELLNAEGVEKHVAFVFAVSGFTEEVVGFFEEHAIAYSDDVGWPGD